MDDLVEAPVILWKERLLQERIQRNWRQHDLAEHLGTSVATIQRWERGSHMPSVYFRVKLCDLYGKNAQELGFIPGNSPSPPSSTQEGTSVAQERAVSAQSTMPGDNNSPPSTRPSKLHDPAIPFSLHKEHALVGRGEEMCLLKRSMLTDAGSLALYGLPGVGKTALAITLAHDPDIAAHFHDGILWAGLGRAPDRWRLLSRWGSLLGLASSEMLSTRTRHPDVLAEMLRDAIGARHMLLILDDAWDAAAALEYQIGGKQCVHLVTTRFPPLAWHFANERALALRELNEQVSMTLLHQLAPAVLDAGFQETQELIRTAGGNPLALTLMGKYLQVQTYDCQPRRLQKALKELFSSDTRLRLSMPQPPMHHHPSLPAHAPLSLQAAIAISEQHLAPQAREGFRSLSVFPAKPNSFSEAAALSVCGLSETELDQYSDAGLLESHSPGRYTLHRVIADYARQMGARMSVEERMVSFFVDLLHTHQHDHDLLEAECTNILTAFELALRRGMTSELKQGIRRLAPFLMARGLYTPAERYLDRAQQATLYRVDDEELVRICFHLGRIAQFHCDLPLAQHHSEGGLPCANRRTEN